MPRKRRGRRTTRIPHLAWHWSLLLSQSFGDRVGRRGSMAAVSEKLGLHPGHMHRVKAHKLGGRPVEVLGGLLVTGDEHPLDLFHETFEEIPRNHVAILACARENQGYLEPSIFLIALAPRLRALVAAGLEPSGSWRSQLTTIRSFERERFNDWKQAVAKLEWTIGVLLLFLEKPGRRTAEALDDLAGAIAGLAAAYRIGGRRDDADDALRMARPLVDLTGGALVEGLWFRKSGYLLVDLNRCDRAYEFMEEAALCFIAAGATAEQAQTLVDQGFVLSHAKKSEAALKVLRRALPLLAEDDTEYRFAAHQLLFIQFRRLGRYEEALAELEKALLLSGDLKLGKAALYWGRAKLAVLLKKPFTEVSRALELYRPYGRVADVAELTFDFAQQLLAEGRRAELKQLTRSTLKWTAEIQGHRKIRQLLESFAALEQLNKLNAASLAALSEKLPPKENTAPRYRRRKFQSPGVNSSPVSGEAAAAGEPPGGNCSPVSGSSAADGVSPGGNCSPISPKKEIN